MESQGKPILKQAQQSIAKANPSNLRVLVVESDPDLQWNLARMLTVQGNRVVGTSSGDGAVALITEWPVDLILVLKNFLAWVGWNSREHLGDSWAITRSF